MALITEHLMAQGLIEAAWVKAAQASFPRHTHDEYVLCANLCGVERVWLDGKVCDVGAGSVTLYNPLAVQGSEFGPQGVEYVSLHLDAQALHRVVLDNQLDGPQGCPVFEQGVLPSAPGLLGAIVEFARAGKAGGEPQAQAFLTLLAQLLQRDSPLAGEQAAAMGWVQDYMRAHLGEGLDLQALADVAGLSKYHFVRCFRKATGLAPLQYLMQLRLMEARRLLRLHQHPLDVANALGFYDQSHFINAFRKVMGVTPKTYAQALQ